MALLPLTPYLLLLPVAQVPAQAMSFNLPLAPLSAPAMLTPFGTRLRAATAAAAT
jgi:hypothetical protein